MALFNQPFLHFVYRAAFIYIKFPTSDYISFFFIFMSITPNSPSGLTPFARRSNFDLATPSVTHCVESSTVFSNNFNYLRVVLMFVSKPRQYQIIIIKSKNRAHWTMYNRNIYFASLWLTLNNFLHRSSSIVRLQKMKYFFYPSRIRIFKKLFYEKLYSSYHTPFCQC